MQITKSQRGPLAVFAIKGAVIADDLEPLITGVQRSFDENVNKIILDFKEVPFIDSAGLEAVQSIVSESGQARGDVCVTSLNDICRDIFMVTRMDNFLQVTDNVDSAVKVLL